MAVGKASLKRAAKAAETEVKTEKLPVSEKEAPEKTETVEEQRFQKDKSRSRNICSRGKTKDNTEKKTGSSQNSRNQNNRSKS